MGYQSTFAICLGRRLAGQRRLALPCPPQTGTGRLDHRRVETDREQPAREILLADPPRPQATRIGSGELAATFVRHLPRHPDIGGIEKYAARTLVVHGAPATPLDPAHLPRGAGTRRGTP